MPFGPFLYLDVLMVHRAFRRRGVATALIEEAKGLARSRGWKLMLVRPQEYEGPSGSLYRKIGFEKASDVFSLETPIGSSQLPPGVLLAPIPRTQEVPTKTHAMVCGWYNISAKSWYSIVNSDFASARFFSYHELAISAITVEREYFLHVGKRVLPSSTCQLCLWAPLPLDETELTNIVQAAKAVSSWFGCKC